MKRCLPCLFIVAYLGALLAGVAGHTARIGTTSHPMMYFLVWDMFCGWSGYEQRHHLIGEGASGRYYELAPGPWGELRPFGRIGRRHYDTHLYFMGRFAVNCLKQTEHEPIVRIFAVEECWQKKFNLPDDVWNRRYNEPKNPHSYYRVRHVLTGDGQLLQTHSAWLAYQADRCVQNNPRLMAEAARGRPFYAVNFEGNAAGVQSGLFPGLPASPVGGAPLGE